MLQSEYEKQYKGDHLAFENGYSSLIATTFIIMMYGSAMPLLYCAGFIICFILYWTDKILFLRYHTIPPRFSLDLAITTRKAMEWAIVLHMLMGLYMLSNPKIFVPDLNSGLLYKYVWA